VSIAATEPNTANRACPFCGEQILAVAVKCKHCGSSITDPAPASAGTAVKNQFKMRPGYVVLLVIILALFGAGWFYNWNRTGTITGKGFSPEDITAIKESIRAEYAKQGAELGKIANVPKKNDYYKVEDVQMIQVSPKKLTGFVKMNVVGVSITKECSATMGDDGQSIWRCE
jgi:hypothetical protein